MPICITRYSMLLLFACLACAARASAASPWLFVTDIHLEAVRDGSNPASYGSDTNSALFARALREMKSVDPDPPVIVIGGDLLAHDMDRAHATKTAVLIAREFDRVYPHAQFVLTLGNNDSNCGDYGVAPNSAFLRAVADAWAPLVNRNNAAPAFLRTFPHDGFYTATLPINGTRAVVVDDVFWSPRYRAGCGRAGSISTTALAELDRALAPSTRHAWLFLHIPPGIDAFSTTHLTHRLAVVPFLDPGPRGKLIAFIGDPARRVTMVIAAHTHKFAYRIVGASGKRPVPMLLAPSISPIFGNAPSFLTAHVDSNGVMSDVDELSFVHGVWRRDGGLASLGVHSVTGHALVSLHARLERDRDLRMRFAKLYNGDAPPEINEANWRSYWCAATEFSSSDFRACTEQGGFSIFTGRGLFVLLGAAGGLALVVLAAIIAFWYVRRHRLSSR
jgi:sphingomyelin phosphodiesterase acid-like 3